MRKDHPIELMVRAHPRLAPLVPQVRAAFALLRACYARGGKLLLCGNGGSAADCEHWAGELLKGFESPRKLSARERAALLRAKRGGAARRDIDALQWALPAIPLTGFPAYHSAWNNDANPAYVYAQLLMSLGRRGDVLVALSTSGNSENILAAARVARAKGIKVLALTGESGGKLATLADIALRAPATNTADVQECHLPIYHCLCRLLENAFEPSARRRL